MRILANSYLILQNDCQIKKFMDLENGNVVLNGINIKIIAGNMLSVVVLKSEDRRVFFIGDFYNPDNIHEQNADIAKRLYKASTFEEMMDLTYSLFGKWIIVEETFQSIRLMGDPSCTKSIKYCDHNLCISDLASLVAYVSSDPCTLDYNVNNDSSKFIKGKFCKCCWWPGDATAFEHVHALLPNHILEYKINATQPETRRYMIVRPKLIEDMKQYNNYCLVRSKQLLAGFLKSLRNRCEFALTVTGGKDSRVLLAACHSNNIDARYFTSIHGSKSLHQEQDVSVAKQLAQSLGFNLDVFDNTRPMQDTIDTIKLYFPELPAEYYASLDYSSNFIKMPQQFKIVLGLIPEIISRYYHRRLLWVTPSTLADLALYPRVKFAEEYFSLWLKEVKNSVIPKYISLLDLFYWEQRSGRWANQTVNVCDSVGNDFIFGFNCMEFYDTNMQLKPGFRQFPERTFMIELTRCFGDRYLHVPYTQLISNHLPVYSILQSCGLEMIYNILKYSYKHFKSC